MMWNFFRRSGWSGIFLGIYVVLFMAIWFPLMINTVSESTALTAMDAVVLKPLIHLQDLAKGNDFWSAVFIAVSVTLEIVFPVATGLWLAQALYRRVRRPPKSVQTYEQHLKEVMKAIRALGNQKQNVPRDVKHLVVRLIKHFEKSVLEILEVDKRSMVRVLWIIEANNSKPLIWSRDRHPTDEELTGILTCFSGSWFTCLDDVQKNPLLQQLDETEAIVCARNLGDFSIGFSIMVDKKMTVSVEKQMALRLHMGFIMLLGEMDMMQQTMLQLSVDDWKAVVI